VIPWERFRKALPWAFGLYAALTLVSMAAMSVGALVLLLTLVLGSGGPASFGAALRLELRRPGARAYAWVSLGLALACLLSLGVAAVFPLSYGGLAPRLHFPGDLAKLWYLAWPLLLLVGLRRLGPGERAGVLCAWLWAFAALSALGIAQHYLGWPRPRGIPFEANRFHTTLFLGHHLSVASIWIFPFFAVFGALWAPDMARAIGLPRRALAAMALLGAGALFFTYSRTLWVALPAGLLAWLLLSLPARKSIPLVLSLGLVLAAASQLPSIHSRLSSQLWMGVR
jgi:hypothetical protein